MLHANEHILAISRGKIARLRWLRRSWLIVVTEKRIICLRSANRTSWRQLEVDTAQISRVALRVGPFRGRVLVVAGGHNYRLLMPRTDAYKVFAAISSLESTAKAVDSDFAPVRMVRRMVEHVLALPAAAVSPYTPKPASKALAPPADAAESDERFQSLGEEMEELRQQVSFLEQLLHQRHANSVPSQEGQ